MDDSELIAQLLTLLDKIEVEDDASLAKDRFIIMEQYGEVVFGPKVSDELQ